MMPSITVTDLASRRARHAAPRQATAAPAGSSVHTFPPAGTAGSATTTEAPPTAARQPFKRAIDLPIALLAILALMPVLLVIALAILVTSGRPIIYRRRIAGQHGREFDAFKFRTMVNGADEVLARDTELRNAFQVNFKLPQDPRVTGLGRLLRRYSLDELPQLVNVVHGQMSLVGPRMISPEELDKYGEQRDKLLSVKPGMTGLWQVSGRQTTSYARRVELDMHYIDHNSIALDLSILARTLLVVVKAQGAS